MSYDKIYIRDLLLRCVIGLYDDERKDKQDIIINITLAADLKKAGESDDIEDSVNYKTIKKKVIELVNNSSPLLIEKLAESICSLCLEDKKVKKVTVSVDKPGALRFARSVAVELTREQE